MLNSVWNSLVNEVEATKKHWWFGERVHKFERKYCAIEDYYNVLVDKPHAQVLMVNGMDKHISFCSQSIVKLENEKAQAVDRQFDNLEQHIAGQDNQIKVLQAHLTIAERGCCRCREDTPKVISCCCSLIPWKLTEDAQEPKVAMETGGLEYEDEEVEAFHCSLIV